MTSFVHFYWYDFKGYFVLSNKKIKNDSYTKSFFGSWMKEKFEYFLKKFPKIKFTLNCEYTKHVHPIHRLQRPKYNLYIYVFCWKLQKKCDPFAWKKKNDMENLQKRPKRTQKFSTQNQTSWNYWLFVHAWRLHGVVVVV